MEELKLRHIPYDQYGKQLESVVSRLNQDPVVDEVSHFVLRLAYCRTEDLRRWLLAQETALMRYRLNFGSSNTVNAAALADAVPEARLLSNAEVDDIWPQLLAASPALTTSDKTTGSSNNNRMVYAIPFTHALDLVATRQVFVHKGMAYIPASKLLHIVTAKFRTHLSRQLVLLSSVPKTDAVMGRTRELVDNLATVSAGSYQEQSNEFGTTGGLKPNTVATHVKNMPLCMVQLHWGLQADKKLKHWGRLQYGLFLKGAGLSMDDALIYFERQFGLAKNFQKEYAYNVRHMYGKEGKRASYPPYSCSKIIHSNPPNANDHHGCPYKHASVAHVTGMLSKLGLSGPQRNSIMALQQSNHFQLACLEHFKAVHPDINSMGGSNVNMDNVGNHPNAWFQASVTYGQNKGDKNSKTLVPAMTGDSDTIMEDSQTSTVAAAISP